MRVCWEVKAVSFMPRIKRYCDRRPDLPQPFAAWAAVVSEAVELTHLRAGSGDKADPDEPGVGFCWKELK